MIGDGLRAVKRGGRGGGKNKERSHGGRGDRTRESERCATEVSSEWSGLDGTGIVKRRGKMRSRFRRCRARGLRESGRERACLKSRGGKWILVKDARGNQPLKERG